MDCGGGDFNMIEQDEDLSNSSPTRITREVQEEWENFIFNLGLEDVWLSDDFTHYNPLNFSWSNKQQGEGLFRPFL